jgi:hypothetical protein
MHVISRIQNYFNSVAWQLQRSDKNRFQITINPILTILLQLQQQQQLQTHQCCYMRNSAHFIVSQLHAIRQASNDHGQFDINLTSAENTQTAS